MQGRDVLLGEGKTGEWCTPGNLYDALDLEFAFTLDAAASNLNALCNKWLTKEDDALSDEVSWPGNVFVNPPYGRIVRRWTAKAASEVATGSANVVVMLLPARTDTLWFHNTVLTTADIVRFVKGRLPFSNMRRDPNLRDRPGAPFPSMIVIWRRSRVPRVPWLRHTGPRFGTQLYLAS